MAPIDDDVPMTPAIVELEEAGVPLTVHEYERGDELRDFGREAADALDLPAEQVFKTLLLTVDDRRDPVVVVVPVSSNVSMKRAAAAVRAKRAVMCDPQVAQRITGYVVGGISPFGQRKRLTTVLDESAAAFDTIYVSGGRRGLDIGVSPTDLVTVLDATLALVAA
jgi:Cys-tRNA(Pro)/Cys-tRNA(Cys) deacylase